MWIFFMSSLQPPLSIFNKTLFLLLVSAVARWNGFNVEGFDVNEGERRVIVYFIEKRAYFVSLKIPIMHLLHSANPKSVHLQSSSEAYKLNKK